MADYLGDFRIEKKHGEFKTHSLIYLHSEHTLFKLLTSKNLQLDVIIGRIYTFMNKLPKECVTGVMDVNLYFNYFPKDRVYDKDRIQKLTKLTDLIDISNWNIIAPDFGHIDKILIVASVYLKDRDLPITVQFTLQCNRN